MRIPFYQIQCECGSLLQVGKAQAGETLSCPACKKQLQIPSLTSLQSRTLDGFIPTANLRPFQFDLAELMAFVTVCALLLSACKTIEYFFSEYWFKPILRSFFFLLLCIMPVVFMLVIQRVSWLFWGLVRRKNNDPDQ
jgi:hypothetical protein